MYERPFTDPLQNGGYEYTATFSQAWGGYLAPVKLTYSSSDPSVVYIDDQGAFCTMAPGTAVLTAVDPSVPNREYALTVQVQDCFQWEYTAPDDFLYLAFTWPFILLIMEA